MNTQLYTPIPKVTLTYIHFNGLVFYWSDVNEHFTTTPTFISYQFNGFVDNNDYLTTQLILGYAYLGSVRTDIPTINITLYK